MACLEYTEPIAAAAVLYTSLNIQGFEDGAYRRCAVFALVLRLCAQTRRAQGWLPVLPVNCVHISVGVQGQTWVRIVVLGQSFMLHQIRKMVGTALAVMRGTAPPDAIPLALSPARQLVRSPSLLLTLCMSPDGVCLSVALYRCASYTLGTFFVFILMGDVFGAAPAYLPLRLSFNGEMG